MGDLRTLLERIEDFRHKWQGEEHSGQPAKLEAVIPLKQLTVRPPTMPAQETVDRVIDPQWHQRYERLRQRWEKCNDQPIVARWRACKDPRLEHHEQTGALLNFWHQDMYSGSAAATICEQLACCIEARLQRFETAVTRVHKQEQWLTRLSRCYEQGLSTGTLAVAEIAALSEELLAEAQQGAPIRWSSDTLETPMELSSAVQDQSPPLQRVAQYALHLAQVVARMLLQDAAWRHHPFPCLTAALLADIGWLTLSPSLWLRPAEQWTVEDKQQAQQHALRSAECLARIAPQLAPLLPVVAEHHKGRRVRSDDSSVVSDSKEVSLAQLLAVADAYVSRRSPLWGGEVRDSRQALTEVLLLAEQGEFDSQAVARLACLSFYPVGTVVELSDGSAAVVLAPPFPPAHPSTAYRPLVARLTNADGTVLPCPELLPLATGDRGLVVRPLPLSQIARLLRYFPDLV
jgi:HD-GYP domain-containing protein (c-di-GMP phosphodiesterase class II)